MTPIVRRVSIPLLAIACACHQDGAGYRQETLDGKLHAINEGSGSWSAAEQWRASLAWKLGAADGDGPDVFGSIAALAVDSIGQLLILDEQAQEVRVFDRSGAFVRALGRRGAGPGEFGRAQGLNLGAQRSLWVWDPSHRRFTVFDSSGQFVRVVPRFTRGVLYPWRGEFDAGGAMIDWGIDRPDARSGDPGARVIFYPIRVDSVTGAVDTLPDLRYEADPFVPFVRGMSVHLVPDGSIWFALTDQYTIFRRTLAGDTTLIVSLRGVEAEPVTLAEQDSVRRLYASLPIDFPRHELDAMPEAKPVIVRIFDNRSGRLLVVPRVAGHAPGSVIDVFEQASGRYLGRVWLPVTIETNPAPVAAFGSLYAMTKGPFEVPEVVRIDLLDPQRK